MAPEIFRILLYVAKIIYLFFFNINIMSMSTTISSYNIRGFKLHYLTNNTSNTTKS